MITAEKTSPDWDIAWQRTFRLTCVHIAAGGTLPAAAGRVIA
ncbi:hypothetical protein [Streptomyces sp. NPDC001312]